jgi:hypothetical protein
VLAISDSLVVRRSWGIFCVDGSMDGWGIPVIFTVIKKERGGKNYVNPSCFDLFRGKLEGR